MKKNKISKKLKLDRETLRNITDEKAELAHGALPCPYLSCKGCVPWTQVESECIC